MTGVTAAAATLGNIGPGFGEVGPMASFGGLLEVVTVLALVRPEVWAVAHWRGAGRS